MLITCHQYSTPWQESTNELLTVYVGLLHTAGIAISQHRVQRAIITLITVSDILGDIAVAESNVCYVRQQRVYAIARPSVRQTRGS